MSYYDDYHDNGRPVSTNLPTKKEAEIIIEKSRDKAFWNCDEVDNYVKLQGSIDVLYNCIPGNEYSVEYKKNTQSTRLEVRCHICDIDLSSYDPFISHDSGKSHKKVRQQKQIPQGSGLNALPKQRKLNSPWDFLEIADGTLEKKLNGTSRTVVGAHMVYKEKNNGVYMYTCTLCQEDGPFHKIPKDEMYKHITSEHHYKKYLDVKFDIQTNHIEEAKNIEEFEGKIHNFLADFSESPEEHSDDHDENNSSQRSRSRSPHRKKSCNGSRRSRPQLMNRGTITSSNDFPMLDVCRPILVELGNLSHVATKDQAAEIVSQDTELQGHLINSLWSLNMRLDKYYEATKKKYVDPKKPTQPIGMKQCSQKIKEYISKLELIEPPRSPEY